MCGVLNFATNLPPKWYMSRWKCKCPCQALCSCFSFKGSSFITITTLQQRTICAVLDIALLLVTQAFRLEFLVVACYHTVAYLCLPTGILITGTVPLLLRTQSVLSVAKMINRKIIISPLLQQQRRPHNTLLLDFTASLPSLQLPCDIELRISFRAWRVLKSRASLRKGSNKKATCGSRGKGVKPPSGLIR